MIKGCDKRTAAPIEPVMPTVHFPGESPPCARCLFAASLSKVPIRKRGTASCPCRHPASPQSELPKCASFSHARRRLSIRAPVPPSCCPSPPSRPSASFDPSTAGGGKAAPRPASASSRPAPRRGTGGPGAGLGPLGRPKGPPRATVQIRQNGAEFSAVGFRPLGPPRPTIKMPTRKR